MKPLLVGLVCGVLVRRYAIQAALGIAAETDDDGRVASGKDVPFE